ncbi:MAG: hypothetical protein R3324_18120, partial [Halobacteriales archaeon]|nr:hypothetical protein [Halobacteriales archaeon]
MTTIAVLVDPPRPGHVLRGLTPPLTPDQAADLYAASVADTFLAVANSGGDLLVNYRDEEDLPVGSNEDQSGEEEVQAIAEEALETVDDVRFEV